LPNLTGLMLGMFALAMMHRALRRRTPSSAAVAAIFLAAVPATNWPSTVALLIAVLCYLTALSLSELRTYLPRIVLIGMMAAAFALPFALPSTILATYGNANIIVDLPTHGPRRWLYEALLLACCLILARTLLSKFRTPFLLRCAVLWQSVLGWVVLSSTLAGVAILPLPLRFHIALEIPLTLASVFLVWQICSRRPAYGFLAASAFALFCFIQM